MTTNRTLITIEAHINAPKEIVWNCWTKPEHITKWSYASDDWCTPRAEVDLNPGGRFTSRMESVDGKMGFDFGGIYTQIELYTKIEQKLDDDRKVVVKFLSESNSTHVIQTFEAEETNPVEMQRGGWLAILNNFKRYAESRHNLESIHFDIYIDASPEKVHQTMIEDESYSIWTAEFNPGSHFKGSWEKGAEIHFIGTDKDGSQGGIGSRVRENIPGKSIELEHLFIIKNNEIEKGNPVADVWSGAREEYTFERKDGGTHLKIRQDIMPAYKSYFMETWPKALIKLKSLCEE